MKKSLLENQIHDEPASRFDSVGKRSLPKLSYREAMRQFFISRSGVHQVNTCSSIEFHEMVKSCANTCKKQPTLKGLCYDELLDKWFALNELLAGGAIVSLYSTAQEAESAILAGNKESEQIEAN